MQLSSTLKLAMETKTVSCNRLYIFWSIYAVWHFNMGCYADCIDDYFAAMPYLLVVLEIACAVRLHIHFEDLVLVMTMKLLVNCSCN